MWRSEKKVLRRAKCTNTEQHRHVFVLLKAATALSDIFEWDSC